MLACLVALVFFWILALAFGAGIIGALATTEKAVVPSESVLVLDVSALVQEQPRELGPSITSFSLEPQPGLYEMVYALRKAANDEKIKGIYLTGGASVNGIATIGEIRDALEEFKKSQKFIWAQADYYYGNGYELASVADSIFMNPAGMLIWNGMGVQTVFIKDLLDKVGVEPVVFYAGDYKSATEMFRLDKMSGPNREQMTEFIHDLYLQTLENVGSARSIDTVTLHQLAENLSVNSASDAVKYGLADFVGYDDQLKKQMAEKLGVEKAEDLSFVTMSEYLENFSLNEGKKGGGRIALLIAEGEIVDGAGQEGQIGSSAFRKEIEKLRNNEDIKAVVLRVNSPGGSALASEVIWRELSLLKSKKPLVVSMGDYAASGGYYISCMADSIFAQPGTLTGSVGVFSLMFDARELLNQKLGITTDEVNTTSNAQLGNPFVEMNAKSKAFMQNSVDSIYQRFLTRVADGRRISVARADSLGKGRIWSGKDAVQNGLADKLGGIDAAIKAAAAMAKLDNYRVSVYPPVVPFLEKILQTEKEKNIQLEAALKQTLGEDFLKTWKMYRTMQSWSGTVQARLPFFTY